MWNMASFSFCVSDEVSCPWRVHQPVCPPGNSFPLGVRFPPPRLRLNQGDSRAAGPPPRPHNKTQNKTHNKTHNRTHKVKWIMASNTSLCLQQVFRRRKIQPTVTKGFLRQQTDSVCVCAVVSSLRSHRFDSHIVPVRASRSNKS